MKLFYAISIILLIGLLSYVNAFDAPMLFDDFLSLEHNDGVLNGVGSPFGLGGRTVLYFTFGLNHWLHGLDVWGYHVTNLAIHLMNGILILLIGMRLFRSILPSTLAALLFVIHPIQTESVTYISSRSELLSALFYLTAVWVFISFSRRSWVMGLGMVGLLWLGVQSKEVAITLPAAILLVDLLFVKDRRFKWGFYFPTFLAAILGSIYLLRGPLSGAVGTGVATSVVSFEYLWTQFTVVPKYLALILYPVGLNISHDIAVITTPDLYTFAFVGGLIAALIIAWLALRHGYPMVAFGILWFGITISPTSSLIPIADPMFEHRVYLPMVGVVLLFAYLMWEVYSRVPRLTLIGVSILIIMLSSLTVSRNEVWRDGVRLWSDSAIKSPILPRPRINLGLAYQERAQYDLALFEYQNALRYSYRSDLPKSIQQRARILAAINGSDIFIKLGRNMEALDLLATLWNEVPGFPGAAINMSVLLANSGQTDAALLIIEEGIINLNAYGPFPYPERLYSNRARILDYQGRCAEALVARDKALQLDPIPGAEVELKTCAQAI